MKKNLYNGILCLLLCLTFSCSQNNQPEPTAKTTIKNDRLEKGSVMRKYYDDGDPNGREGISYGCSSEPENCLPDLVCNPSYFVVFNAAFNTIGTGNISAIQGFFNANRSTLIQHISTSTVDATIAGNYTVTSRGTDPNQNRYMIFTNVGTQVIDEVYPIR